MRGLCALTCSLALTEKILSVSIFYTVSDELMMNEGGV